MSNYRSNSLMGNVSVTYPTVTYPVYGGQGGGGGGSGGGASPHASTEAEVHRRDLIDLKTKLILAQEKLDIAIKTITAMAGPDFDSLELGATNEDRQALSEIVKKVLQDAARAEIDKREKAQKYMLSDAHDLGGPSFTWSDPHLSYHVNANSVNLTAADIKIMRDAITTMRP